MDKNHLGVVVASLSFSADKPLDFHDTTFRYNKTIEILGYFVIQHY